jgi:hypothetical protein
MKSDVIEIGPKGQSIFKPQNRSTTPGARMGKVRSRPAQNYLEESIFDSVLPELLLADAGPAAGVGGKAKAGGTITVMVPETKPCNTESEWRYQEPVLDDLDQLHTKKPRSSCMQYHSTQQAPWLWQQRKAWAAAIA